MSQELQAAVVNFATTVDELVNLSDAMRDDIFQVLNALARDLPNQMVRRSFVRSSWAYVEGVTFAIKRYTLSACQLSARDLPPDDQAFLSDLHLVVNTDGDVEVRKGSTKTLDNVKRTFKLSADLFDLNWTPDFGSGGWAQLHESLEIRHRITHPKTTAEFAIADGDIKTQREGISWFVECFNEYQDRLIERYAKT